MQGFLIKHIDDFISIGLGTALTIYAWRDRERLRASPQKIVRLLPVLAPLVIVFGVLQLALNLYTPDTYKWERAYTGDQHASAEFPATTTVESHVDSAQGVSVKRVVINCDLRQKDINLRLSYNERSPDAPRLTAEQYIASLKSYFEQQGATTVSSGLDTNGGDPGIRMTTRMEREKVQSVMRAAITSNGVYRVIATSPIGSSDGAVISRFLDSFKLE